MDEDRLPRILSWRSSYYDSVVAHYILIWFLTSVYGGQWRFENIGLNISKRRRIVTKFGTSVDGGKTQLLHVQIFDICPQKILAPL